MSIGVNIIKNLHTEGLMKSFLVTLLLEDGIYIN